MLYSPQRSPSLFTAVNALSAAVGYLFLVVTMLFIVVTDTLSALELQRLRRSGISFDLLWIYKELIIGSGLLIM